MNENLLSPRQVIFLSIFLPTLLLVTVRLILFSSQLGSPLVALSLFYISVLTPLPFGILAGLTWRGAHPVGYILMGFCIGMLAMIGVLASIRFVEGPGVFGSGVTEPGPYYGHRYTIQNWLEVVAFYPLLSTFLFASGGLFGDYVESRSDQPSTGAILGVVSVAITAVGTIVGALVQ